ncbi:MAG: DUF4301 family protein [Thermodesulfobacteriota bacterium]
MNSSSLEKNQTFGAKDRLQIKSLGLSEEEVRRQIQILELSPPRIRLHRPCTVGDGIQQINAEDLKTYIALQERAAGEGRFMKFVPASGVASRMFQLLFKVYYQPPRSSKDPLPGPADREVPEARGFISFQEGIKRFAFFDDLKHLMADHGLQVEELIAQGQWHEILRYLLTEEGLNYGALPKGLLKFHRCPSGSRTAFEEHLIEAGHTVRDREGICHLCFTVSPEHEDAFRRFFERIKPQYEQLCQARFEVAFSIQKHSTDAIAVDLENRPFREKDGRLLFRPGGHGALLVNLNDLQGDLVYVRNIDNVAGDRLNEAIIAWKKALGGILVKIQGIVHRYVKELTESGDDHGLIEEAKTFVREKLLIPEPQGFKRWTPKRQRDFLLNRLNRPIRVCGMVENAGEPGGAPFWVKGRDGRLSLQIVESAQVDSTSSKQQKIWNASTHFNPVDLVCGLKDFEGRPFDLHRYGDPEAVFISQKSKDGQALKSLEWPGLWNGAMFDWITLFIEVPRMTFNPVKTINDLLRPGHQPILRIDG